MDENMGDPCIRNNAQNNSQLSYLNHWLRQIFEDCCTWLISTIAIIRHIHAEFISRSVVHFTDKNLEDVSETRNWMEASIRFIAFHPNSQYSFMALVTKEDSVLLFHQRCKSGTRLEKSGEQSHATCAAFRPWTFSDIAVGCGAGICYWSSQNRFGVNKQQINVVDSYCMKMLTYKDHVYVTSLEWTRDGNMLVSAALGTRDIVIWEPDRGDKMRLLSGSKSSFRFVRLGSRSQFLFGACSNGGSIVWRIKGCQMRKKHIFGQRRIQSAAWTGCGSHLLFIEENSTLLYAWTPYPEAWIFLHPTANWKDQLVADFDRCSCFAQHRECGYPQAIAIDPLNVYVAFIFKNQPFVLLCLLVLTQDSPIRVLPLDYILYNGNAAKGVYPTCMNFDHQGRDLPWYRCLVIAWSTGQIQRQIFTAQSLQEAQKLMRRKWNLHNIDLNMNMNCQETDSDTEPVEMLYKS